MIRLATLCLATVLGLGTLTFTGCETFGGGKKEAAAAVPEGFTAKETEEGYYVVMTSDAEHVKTLEEKGELEKPVTAVGERVNGKKLFAPDTKTLNAYLDAKAKK